eukprot:1509270-Ditylum_brightwellii.AAC.1
MVATLSDELQIVPPLREYFVGHSVERMDEGMRSVSEAEGTAQALVKEKSWENQVAKYDSSSSLSDYPVGAYGGQCCEQ